MTGSPLVGRSTEQAALAGLIGSLSEGLSGALVLRGDAGVGKTALLRELPRAAPGVKFAWLAGVESETSLGFAGLHRLLIPYLSRLQDLPAAQRSALGSALGLTEPRPANAFLIGQAGLTILADAAHSCPLVCVIDDAQWLDQESLGVVAFIARRLFAEQLGIVFAVREPPRNRLLEGIADLTIEGLGRHEAAALLTAVTAGRVDRQVAERLSGMVDGNPLALTEVGRQLVEGQLAPDSLLSGPLPLGERLEEHFRTEVQNLPAACRAVLLLAAAHTGADLNVLWRAAALDGLGPDAVAPAAMSFLVDRGTEVRFRHPLIRAAVYACASPAERRHAHHSLASVVDRNTDRDQRAWHLAAATLMPDENVAAELQACAEITRGRGGFLAEAIFLGRAGSLSPDPSRAATRYLDGAVAALRGGATHRAAELLDLATPNLREPFARVRAELIRADITTRSGESQVALTSVRLRAARDLLTSDAALARRTLLEAVQFGLIGGPFIMGTTPAELGATALELWPQEHGGSGIDDLLLRGFATLMSNGYVEAAPVLHRALAMMEQNLGRVEEHRLLAARSDIDLRIELGALAADCLRDDRARITKYQRKG